MEFGYITEDNYQEIWNEGNKFYRLPKMLFADEKYVGISAPAKFLYMILLDRWCLFESNGKNWRDEYGCVFIYFTIEEMMKLTQHGNKMINGLLEELEDHDLILNIQNKCG